MELSDLAYLAEDKLMCNFNGYISNLFSVVPSCSILCPFYKYAFLGLNNHFPQPLRSPVFFPAP